jgi:hypothetical protein
MNERKREKLIRKGSDRKEAVKVGELTGWSEAKATFLSDRVYLAIHLKTGGAQ